MPNSNGQSMRAITKPLKPPFSFLQFEWNMSVIFVDGCYAKGDSFTECSENFLRKMEILGAQIFTLKSENIKSKIISKQKIIFLDS